MDNANTRLNDVIRRLGLTQKQLAYELGTSQPAISAIAKGTRPLTEGFACRVESLYGVSSTWLLTGEGEMLKHQDNGAEMPVGEYREDEVPDRYMTRLVPMSAMGGSLVGFEESGVRREDCEKVVSPIAGADWAVPVCGDSMEPEYPNGSRVFVKQINPGDFIQWGNVFVLDTTNGLVIKMVMQSDKKDCIKCVSLNPSGRYQPFDVPMRTVRAMYRVLLCVSIK